MGWPVICGFPGHNLHCVMGWPVICGFPGHNLHCVMGWPVICGFPGIIFIVSLVGCDLRFSGA